jgi:hypothetical protein
VGFYGRALPARRPGARGSDREVLDGATPIVTWRRRVARLHRAFAAPRSGQTGFDMGRMKNSQVFQKYGSAASIPTSFSTTTTIQEQTEAIGYAEWNVVARVPCRT